MNLGLIIWFEEPFRVATFLMEYQGSPDVSPSQTLGNPHRNTRPNEPKGMNLLSIIFFLKLFSLIPEGSKESWHTFILKKRNNYFTKLPLQKPQDDIVIMNTATQLDTSW